MSNGNSTSRTRLITYTPLVECSEILIQLGGQQGSGLGLCRLHVRVHALVWSLVESHRLVTAVRSSYLFVPRQRSGLGNRCRLDLQLCYRKLEQRFSSEYYRALMLKGLQGLATPPLISNTGYGTFVFFAAFSVLSGVWTYFCVPETK